MHSGAFCDTLCAECRETGCSELVPRGVDDRDPYLRRRPRRPTGNIGFRCAVAVGSAETD